MEFKESLEFRNQYQTQPKPILQSIEEHGKWQHEQTIQIQYTSKTGNKLVETTQKRDTIDEAKEAIAKIKNGKAPRHSTIWN